MLPIPVPIIGSNKRLFIPLIYLVVTASICYLFLIALVGVNYKSNKNITTNNINSNKRSIQHLKHKQKNQDHNFGKYKREVDTDLLYKASVSDSQKVSTFASRKSKKKKEKEKITTGQNGTWRSDSTEIRSRNKNYIWNWIVDNQAPSHQPWPYDKQCEKFRINFAKKGTFKPRALVSFPGSGNSWLRFLIDSSTGFFTGSIFHDQIIYSSGLLGEMRPPNDGSTIVQKTHHDTTYLSSSKTRQAYVKLTELMFGYRGILLIRNPYDALISYWNFISTRDHKGLANQHNFPTFEWIKFVTVEISRWSSLIISWVDNSESILIVEYEKLKKNPRKELIRILQYLDQPVNESRLDCLLKTEHIEGPFHRKHPNDSLNNNSSKRTAQGSETKEKNLFLDFTEDPGWNSKSWKNGEQQSSWTDKNISPNNDYHQPSLDLIIQDNIHKINRFFNQKDIPILLKYTEPSGCCQI